MINPVNISPTNLITQYRMRNNKGSENACRVIQITPVQAFFMLMIFMAKPRIWSVQ